MLLTVDVGNTNVVLGVFENRKMIGSWRMATDNKRSADEYGVIIDQMFRHDGINPKDIDDAISIRRLAPEGSGTAVWELGVHIAE